MPATEGERTMTKTIRECWVYECKTDGITNGTTIVWDEDPGVPEAFHSFAIWEDGERGDYGFNTREEAEIYIRDYNTPAAQAERAESWRRQMANCRVQSPFGPR
jgi:hypothetical protein